MSTRGKKFDFSSLSLEEVREKMTDSSIGNDEYRALKARYKELADPAPPISKRLLPTRRQS